MTLNYRQLRRLPSVEVPAFIECAGNGRSFFNTQQGTPASGTQWGLGAIGVGNWRGVPLAEVLERAGISRGAVDIMPASLDPDYVTGFDYGSVRRPLPIAKAFENAILAYELNGQPLPPDNGYPVRLVVPGWVGVANIKWVGQIQVSREPLDLLEHPQPHPRRPGVPRPDPAHHSGGQERLRARPQRHAAQPVAGAERPVVVGARPDQAS